MSTVHVQLQISAMDKFHGAGEASRTYRASYFIGRGTGFVGGSGAATLTTATDAPLSLVFENDGAFKRVAFMVSGTVRQPIGSVAVPDSPAVGDMAQPEHVFVEFENAMSLAFFNATCALVVGVDASPVAPHNSASLSVAQPAVVSITPAVMAHDGGGTGRAKQGVRRFFVKRNLIVTGLLVGAAMTVYGMTIGKPPVDPIKASMQGENYADLQAQIRAQIAAAAKSDVPLINGKNDGLGGQNVAIETMKAMGLDPGKANAGCLVGVK